MKTFTACLTTVTDELSTLLKTIDPHQVDAVIPLLAGAQRIFTYACGRSRSILECFTKRLFHLGKRVYEIGGTTTPAVAPGDILVIASGSGQTTTVAAIAQKALDLGAHIIAISANTDSPLAECSHDLVVIPAPFKGEPTGETGSVQPMATLFEQALLILLDVIVPMLMDTLDISEESMRTRHANLE